MSIPVDGPTKDMPPERLRQMVPRLPVPTREERDVMGEGYKLQLLKTNGLRSQSQTKVKTGPERRKSRAERAATRSLGGEDIGFEDANPLFQIQAPSRAGRSSRARAQFSSPSMFMHHERKPQRKFPTAPAHRSMTSLASTTDLLETASSSRSLFLNIATGDGGGGSPIPGLRPNQQ
ncbi:hypothetical protein GALMADRAFT_147612 [Galerina marginata CBS 339.88]|uniref:Uncharacterized protein n=1 Tax=Galerina marginata (strain CBS 339.88) TaxID=685588 RepID=A0A067SIW9_GALM3|nr:hypothetical protein GALMADRAFT_147612 [Galerina marginata CBS 339.88]